MVYKVVKAVASARGGNIIIPPQHPEPQLVQ